MGSSKDWNKLLKIFENQKGICPILGVKMTLGVNARLDHIVSKSKGGLNIESNLQWLYCDKNVDINALKHNCSPIILDKVACRMVEFKKNQIAIDSKSFCDYIGSINNFKGGNKLLDSNADSDIKETDDFNCEIKEVVEEKADFDCEIKEATEEVATVTTEEEESSDSNQIYIKIYEYINENPGDFFVMFWEVWDQKILGVPNTNTKGITIKDMATLLNNMGLTNLVIKDMPKERDPKNPLPQEIQCLRAIFKSLNILSRFKEDSQITCKKHIYKKLNNKKAVLVMFTHLLIWYSRPQRPTSNLYAKRSIEVLRSALQDVIAHPSLQNENYLNEKNVMFKALELAKDNIEKINKKSKNNKIKLLYTFSAGDICFIDSKPESETKVKYDKIKVAKLLAHQEAAIAELKNALI